MKGKVKWFDKHRGFGFIISDSDEDQKEYFFHWSAIQSAEEFKTVAENQKVEFEIEKNSEKGDRATSVKEL